MTLERWLEAHNISVMDFEGMSGVPYQRISEHIRLKKPLSEKHVLNILKATNCEVSPETLRPSLKPIFQLIGDRRRAFVRRMTGFACGLVTVLGIFAFMIFSGPAEFPDAVIAESQHHYEEARKAAGSGEFDLALSHLNAIEKKTPAWYESRDLHWRVKEELNTYAHKGQE
ncbi:MAG: hypothetical protein AB1499_07940 [Nitrospirota bacterium]